MIDQTVSDQPATDQDRIHDEVRARYAEAALAAGLRRSDSAAQASCCGPDGGALFGQLLYDPAERAGLPEAAVLASLGCGNPSAVAELRAGERVLDLGSGGGIDVILSARRVGWPRAWRSWTSGSIRVVLVRAMGAFYR